VAGEGDEAAVAANGGVVGVGVALRAGRGDADAANGAGGHVLEKDVAREIGVAGDAVVGVGLEGDEVAVVAHGGELGIAVAAGPVCLGADELEGAGGAVLAEDVRVAAVDVSRGAEQVGGLGVENDVVAVRADGGGRAIVVGLHVGGSLTAADDG